MTPDVILQPYILDASPHVFSYYIHESTCNLLLRSRRESREVCHEGLHRGQPLQNHVCHRAVVPATLQIACESACHRCDGLAEHVTLFPARREQRPLQVECAGE